jgi:hypothetical protein
MLNDLFHKFLLLFSLLLALAGGLMVLDSSGTKDLVIGLTVLVFFGLCAGALAHHLGGLRESRFHAKDLSVILAPGSKFAVRKGRILALGLVFLLVGALGSVSAHYEGEMVIGGGAIMGGLVLLLLLGLGLIGSDYLLFEPRGLRVGDKNGSMLLAWDNIAGVEPGYRQDNQALFLRVRDPQALAATATGGAGKWGPEAILKGTAWNRTWLRCDWMVLTGPYGLNATLLAKAIATYAADPKVRSGLEERLSLKA